MYLFCGCVGGDLGVCNEQIMISYGVVRVISVRCWGGGWGGGGMMCGLCVLEKFTYEEG